MGMSRSVGRGATQKMEHTGSHPDVTALDRVAQEWTFVDFLGVSGKERHD